MKPANLEAVRYHDKVHMLAITGGPCGGKDTLMAHARQWLEQQGWHVRVLTETATELIQAGFSPGAADWPDPLAFQRHVALYSLEREVRYLAMIEEQKLPGKCVLLCNRGVLDGIVYAGWPGFYTIVTQAGHSVTALRERYRGAVHLVTAADGAEAHYTRANNTARTESPEQARERDLLTQKAWMGHRHFHIIDNRTDFNGKVRRALGAIARMLDMPEPLEKEHKFLLRNFNPGMIPRDAHHIGIVQTYLANAGGVERRVRKRSTDATDTYFYTEKELTAVKGQRVEREREIKKEEFVRLLGERKQDARRIVKVRRAFSWGGRRFELDEYHEPVKGLFILEVEVSDLSESIELPPEWEAVAVTGDERYSNYGIAHGLLPSEAAA